MRDLPRRFSDSVDVGSGSMLMVCGRDGSVLTEGRMREGSVLTMSRVDMSSGAPLTKALGYPGCF